MLNFLDVYERALKGPIMSGKEYDMKLFIPTLRQVVKDHAIRYDPENPVPCAWHLIVERLSKFNALDKLAEIQKAKDWSPARDGGPRRRVREDLRIEAEEETVESQS